MHAVENSTGARLQVLDYHVVIRQAITRGIANTGRTIRLPVHAVTPWRACRRPSHDWN